MGRVGFTVAVLVSLLVLFTPAAGVPDAAPGSDKLIHLGVFGLLALTGRWAGIPPLPLVLGLTAYAVGSELLQGVPLIGRHGDVLDGVVDCLGISLGILLYAVLTRRRQPRT